MLRGRVVKGRRCFVAPTRPQKLVAKMAKMAKNHFLRSTSSFKTRVLRFSTPRSTKRCLSSPSQVGRTILEGTLTWHSILKRVARSTRSFRVSTQSDRHARTLGPLSGPGAVSSCPLLLGVQTGLHLERKVETQGQVRMLMCTSLFPAMRGVRRQRLMTVRLV